MLHPSSTDLVNFRCRQHMQLTNHHISPYIPTNRGHKTMSVCLGTGDAVNKSIFLFFYLSIVTIISLASGLAPCQYTFVPDELTWAMYYPWALWPVHLCTCMLVVTHPKQQEFWLDRDCYRTVWNAGFYRFF